MLEYDDVLNQQRTVVYQIDARILEGEENIHDLVRDMIAQVVQNIVWGNIPGRVLTADGVTGTNTILSHITSVPLEEFER